jgi:hypothetical protein
MPGIAVKRDRDQFPTSQISRRARTKNPVGRWGRPALSIGHSRVHKKNQQQSNHNQDHPHNRPNNQTGHISKGVGSMTAYYGYLGGYPKDYR